MISIHAPRKGCDYLIAQTRVLETEFQSTHPARGATRSCRRGRWSSLYFNPRTPQGVRLLGRMISAVETVFQSTHPARGATARSQKIPPFRLISIHAPRKGCDTACSRRMWWRSYFNPRTPQGVRHNAHAGQGQLGIFQSTHPARGATSAVSCPISASFYFNPRTPQGVRLFDDNPEYEAFVISIHAPRKGCDRRSLGSPYGA